MGVAGVVLFGLPGLVGFAAKKHDYVFSINYVDTTGNTQVAAVEFKNNVPANQFMMEMTGMTGLSVGQLLLCGCVDAGLAVVHKGRPVHGNLA
jgi:hypothetical protein